MQLLHHAATYNSPWAYFLVGSDVHLLAVYKIRLHAELIAAYQRICDSFYENDLKLFYEPGDVPELPEKWINALKSPKLKYLKMDSDSWKYAISIWRILNIDYDSKDGCKITPHFHYPLPPIVRIVPLIISMWNALKGGGDTITKLLDGCKEQVGIRSECVMASARLFLYFSIMFHRLHQWCNAKVDLDFYPSAEHARYANSKRSTFSKTLALLCEMLISQSVRGGEASMQDDQTVHYNELLAVPECNSDGELDSDEYGSGKRKRGRARTRSRSNSLPGPVQLDAPGGKTGITPKHRAGSNPLFLERCQSCIGLYFGKMVADPNIDRVVVDSRLRRMCYVCNTNTDWFCFGCRRWLCMSPPKLKDSDTPQPKYFAVNTPVLNKQGDFQKEADGSLKKVKEFGVWTCFHKAHEPGWKAFILANRAELMHRGTAKRQRSYSL